MNKSRHRLLIRADASATIGLGHVMRCIALGQYWLTEVGEVHFLCREVTSQLQNRIASEGFQLHQVPSQLELLDESGYVKKLTQDLESSVLVLDGYQFDDAYQAISFPESTVNLVFDDHQHARHMAADCIVNLNLGAEKLEYSRASGKQLLGAEYALIRREFRESVSSPPVVPKLARKLLVTFGGSDPTNATSWVAESLLNCCVKTDWQIRLLLGSGYRHGKALENLVQSHSEIETVSSVEDVSPLYLWSDMAICAGGGANWEMSLFGIPRVVVPIAENQVPGTIAMESTGCCWTTTIGESKSLATKVQQLAESPAVRSRMSRASRKLIDGFGGKRITEELLKLIKLKASHGLPSV